MNKIEIYGIRLEYEVEVGVDLSKIIVEEAEKQIGGLREGDVVVITSKIISKSEGLIYRIDDVVPSRKTRLLSTFYGIDPKIMEIYMKQGKVRVVIPLEKISKGGLLEKYSEDRRTAREVISEDPYLFLIEKNGRLLSWGGVDFSNSPLGFFTEIPADPDESAKRIREGIRKILGFDVAVVITDTEWKLDKFGTVDVAIGSSGIEPVSRKFGKKDMYGRPKLGGVDSIVDLLSSAAALFFGQTDERIPIAIVRGFNYERSEKGTGDTTFPEGLIRRAFISVLWETLKFKIISKVLR
ncbi:MAG: coenzyme F420-0:L-glutamate ligase [Candidatus Asgardarchaeia archaeon]